MTEEKIEEQVEEYTKHNATIFYDARTDNPVYDDTEEIKQAWKDGAKWMQEKLKCCGNCKYEYCHGVCISPEKCVDMNKWELKE